MIKFKAAQGGRFLIAKNAYKMILDRIPRGSQSSEANRIPPWREAIGLIAVQPAAEKPVAQRGAAALRKVAELLAVASKKARAEGSLQATPTNYG